MSPDITPSLLLEFSMEGNDHSAVLHPGEFDGFLWERIARMCETWNDPRLHHVCPCIMVTFLLAVSKYPIKQLSRRTVCFSSGSEEEYSQWGLGRFGVGNTRQLVMLTHSEVIRLQGTVTPFFQ